MQNFLIQFIYNKQIETYKLNDYDKSSVTIGKDLNNDITIKSNAIEDVELVIKKSGKDYIIKSESNKGFYYNDERRQEKLLKDNDIISVGKRTPIIILFSSIEKFGSVYEKYNIKPCDSITIGRDESSTITCLYNLVSKDHATLYKKSEDKYVIFEENTKNGLFINNKKVSSKLLEDGDIINFFGYTIRYQDNTLSIPKTEQIIVNTLEKVREKREEQEFTIYQPLIEQREKTEAKYPYVLRSPRIIPYIPSGTIDVEDPPTMPSKPQINLLTTLLPPIAMGMMAYVMSKVLNFGSFIYFTTAMYTITLVVTISNHISKVKKYKKDTIKRQHIYDEYLNKLSNDLRKKIDKHWQALHTLYPDKEGCLDITNKKNRLLWNCKPMDEGFLNIRIGIGNVPSKYTLNLPKIQLTLEPDPLKEKTQQFFEEFSFVPNVPIDISLLDYSTVGLVGNRSKVIQLTRSIIIQICTKFAYDEVKIACIYNEKESKEWEWVKWVPHIWDDDRRFRFIANDRESVYNLSLVMNDMIKTREKRLSEKQQSDKSLFLPHIIFILCDRSLLEYQPIMKYITKNNQELGLSSIYLFNQVEQLPEQCKAIIEVENKDANLYLQGEDKDHTYFTIDTVDTKTAEYYSRSLAPVRINKISNSGEIPTKLTFLELYNVTKIEQLDIMNRWQHSKAYDTLMAVVGKADGGSDFAIDIHEKEHGPHGLIAGTTGSGKSEFLQSMIISIAVNYHPYDVVFVLIDYKGGGMANIFKGLPHLVGTITNLEGNETNRALLSIKSELKRRQKLLAKYDISSYIEYQKLYKTRQVEEPLPHLIIVSDEFAELKAEKPEFMKELVSTARVGRSLGVHLILATQKPAGVVNDQIWSNSRFRICLKVQNESESKEVIKRSEAAYIKQPGRCYIQVGNDELFEQFQSAFSGADYTPGKKDDDTIKIVGLNGIRHKINDDESALEEHTIYTELNAMVDYMKMIAKESNLLPLKGPWLPPLKEKIYLTNLLEDIPYGFNGREWKTYNQWLRPVVGQVDDPAHQKQEKLIVDIAKNGHLIVFGAPGKGKTIYLQTLATSLIYLYSPEEVSIYVMDFGGRTFNTFEHAPHVGGIVYQVDDEKTVNLFKMLIREMEMRKQLFSELGITGGLKAYRESSDNKLPAIILIIDNFAAIKEDGEELFDYIVTLTREAGNYGIYIIMSTNSTITVSYRINQNVTNLVALQMADMSEYSVIVGRSTIYPSQYPGRGLIKADPPLEFQTALPIKVKREIDISKRLKELFINMCEKWKGKVASPIPVMPEKLTLQHFMENSQVKDLINTKDFILPIGLSLEEIEPVTLDVWQNSIVLNPGISYSGKTSFIYAFIKMCKMKYENKSQVYIINTKDNLSELEDKNYITGYIKSEQEIDIFINELNEKISIREQEIQRAKVEQTETFNPKQYVLDNYIIESIIVLNYHQFFEVITEESKELLEELIMEAKHLGFIFIFSGDVKDMNNHYNFYKESLMIKLANQKNGILIGGTLSDYLMYNTNHLSFSERNYEMRLGDAYLISKNDFKKIKFIYSEI